ncbi:MAG: late competence development ComFB family protein [Firmicutes bacterium]|nr:late competence development ComFB family protein [Bacillota bacterium]
MEETVLKVLDEILEKEKNICKCEQCRLDIAAIALNNLPPRYVVTSKGASYARADLLEMQKYIDIMGAISKGIKLVKEHPRH